MMNGWISSVWMDGEMDEGGVKEKAVVFFQSLESASKCS
jgi:hypothetical protein